MEERCIQFHEDAMRAYGLDEEGGTTSTTSTKKINVSKQVATLRKFLHNNQHQRFPDKATIRLFATIQIYTSSTSVPKEKTTTSAVLTDDDKEALLEDALKMPFTVFGTKQKKTFLKRLEEVRSRRQDTDTTLMLTTTKVWSVIDIQSTHNDTDNDTVTTMLTLMKLSDDNDNNNNNNNNTEDDGTIQVALPSGQLGQKIQTAFAESDETIDVYLQKDTQSQHYTVVDLVE